MVVKNFIVILMLLPLNKSGEAMLPPVLFYSFLHRRIFAVPQHLAELHGVGVALGGEHEHLAEAV